MMRRTLTTLTLALLSGCASAPDNHYFALSAEPAAESSTEPGPSLRLVSVRLPGVTDRPQMVLKSGANGIEIREFDRWAEPLDDMVQSVLARDLASRSRKRVTSDPETRLYVVFDEFITDTHGIGHISGHWWTRAAAGVETGPIADHSFSFDDTGSTFSPDPAAGVLSHLLGRLADTIIRS